MSNEKTVQWRGDRLTHWMISELEEMRRSIIKMGLEDVTGEVISDHDLVEEKNIVYKNDIVEGPLPGSSSKLSVDATIALMLQYGDFYLPEEARQFIKECYDNSELRLDNLPTSEELLEKGKAIVDAFIEAEYPYYSAVALTGATFIECGWNVNVYNKLEKSGRGEPGTSGWENCGEGLFGITFWKQKERIIKKLGITSPPVSSNIEIYRKEVTDARPYVHLCDLNEEYWGKIAKIYLEDIAQKQNEKLIREDLTGDTEYLETLAASYLWKAGQARNPEFDIAKKTAEIYQKVHTRQNNGKPAMNSFAQQLCVSIILDQYIHGLEDFSLEELGIDFKKNIKDDTSTKAADKIRNSYKRNNGQQNNIETSLYTQKKKKKSVKKA